MSYYLAEMKLVTHEQKLEPDHVGSNPSCSTSYVAIDTASVFWYLSVYISLSYSVYNTWHMVGYSYTALLEMSKFLLAFGLTTASIKRQASILA